MFILTIDKKDVKISIGNGIGRVVLKVYSIRRTKQW